MRRYAVIYVVILCCIVACKSKKQPQQVGASYPIVEKVDEKRYGQQQSYPDLDSILANIPLNAGYPKPTGHTFAVDKVQKASSKLRVFPAQAVIQQKVGKRLLFTATEYRDYAVAYSSNNSLIDVVQECYATHRPLILTPDAIWLAICQGVSLHINQHFDELEPVIFVKDKPKVIHVREDSLLSEPEAWVRITDAFAEEANRYTNEGMYGLFVPTFSTTTRVEQTAYTITMLEALKKTFVYVGEMECGLPSVTIAGTKEDWELIYNSLASFRKLGLGVWIDNLEPIIKEFIAAADGKPNVKFWQYIYKDASEYAEFYISGWIVKFFPYLVKNGEVVTEPAEENSYMAKLERVYIPNEYIEGDRYLLSTLSTDDFPSGIAQVEIVVNNHIEGTSILLDIYAGFMGMKQYSDGSLEPFISWGVCPKDAPVVNYASRLYQGPGEQLTHKPEYWYPHLIDDAKLIQQAVYTPSKNHSSLKSKELLVAGIRDSLRSFVSEHQLKLGKEVKVCFVVTSNGTVIDVKMVDPEDKPELSTYVKHLLSTLPEAWKPATAYVKDVFYETEEEEEREKQISVNSKIYIAIDL